MDLYCSVPSGLELVQERNDVHARTDRSVVTRTAVDAFAANCSCASVRAVNVRSCFVASRLASLISCEASSEACMPVNTDRCRELQIFRWC
jgi:hypothetical protein